jgi:hypothetical protein
MRILLITPSDAGGHHNEYKALLTKAFIELGHEVLHFSQRNVNSIKINQSVPAFAKKSKCLSNVYFKYHKYRISLWHIRHRALKNWQVLLEYIQHLQNDSNRPDLLFFESLDAFTGCYLTKWDIDNKLTIPFSGILISPSDKRLMTKSYFRKGPFDLYQILKSKWCKSIGVLMEEVIPILSTLIHKPIIELPDIVSIPESIQDNSLSELVRNRANDRFTVGIWGSLEQRKGTTEFLQMCLKLPPEKYFFVMGGRIHHDNWPEKDKNILKQSNSGIIENLLIVDKWLTDDELFSGMLSCDLIFASYPGWKYTSGIIGKAAVLGVPILVNDGFVMAKRVKDYSIGFVKQEQADFTKWILSNTDAIKKLRSSSSFKDGCSKYCERYGYEQWRKSLAHLINVNLSY